MERSLLKLDIVVEKDETGRIETFGFIISKLIELQGIQEITVTVSGDLEDGRSINWQKKFKKEVKK